MKPEQSDITVNSLSAISHILTHVPHRLKKISILIPEERWSERLRDLNALALKKRVQVNHNYSKDKSPDPVIATVGAFPYLELKEFLGTVGEIQKGVVLVLDHLQDPQNFGALARTAEGLGVLGIIVPKDRGVTVTGGVYAASVGAVETIPIILVANVAEALRRLKEHEFWILGTSLGENTKELKETPDFEKVAIVLGSELEGMASIVEKTCDWLVHIPLKGKVQSLNVSNAGAILMHHFCK